MSRMEKVYVRYSNDSRLLIGDDLTSEDLDNLWEYVAGTKEDVENTEIVETLLNVPEYITHLLLARLTRAENQVKEYKKKALELTNMIVEGY